MTWVMSTLRIIATEFWLMFKYIFPELLRVNYKLSM